MSTETISGPVPFLTPGRVKRLVKFGLVGVSGVFVNLAVFELLFRLVDLRFALAVTLLEPFKLDPQFVIANVVGVIVSIFTNFLLNDMWTWGDRVKGTRRRDWFRRLTKYYVSALVAAGVQLLVASVAVALVFESLVVDIPAVVPVEATTIDIAPTLAVLTGIIAGMGINFLASHLWAFRDAEVEE